MRAGWGRRPRSSFPAEASGVACPSPWPWGSPLCRRCRQTHPPHLAHPGPRREPSALRPDRRSRSPFPPCPLPPPPPGPGSFPVRAMPPRGPRGLLAVPVHYFLSLALSLSTPLSPLRTGFPAPSHVPDRYYPTRPPILRCPPEPRLFPFVPSPIPTWPPGPRIAGLTGSSRFSSGAFLQHRTLWPSTALELLVYRGVICRCARCCLPPPAWCLPVSGCCPRPLLSVAPAFAAASVLTPSAVPLCGCSGPAPQPRLVP